MIERAQRQMVFHGAVVLFGGMLTGLPLAVAIVDDWGHEAIRAWAVTHSSLVAAGIALIAIGAALRHLVIAERQLALFVSAMVGANYVLCLGLVVSAATGERGLTAAGPALNVILHVANVIGVLGALLAGALLVRGAYAGLRDAGRSLAGDAAVGAR